MFSQHGYKVEVANMTFKYPKSISYSAANAPSLQVPRGEKRIN